MVAIIEILLVGYIGWLLWLWSKIRRQDVDQPTTGPFPPATLLIAFRNEEAQLPALLTRLTSQPAIDIQILAIDDYSTDRSAQIVQDFQARVGEHRLRYLHNAALPGKRAAIATGIAASQTDLILQTDADCHPSSEWFQSSIKVATTTQAAITIFPLRFHSNIEHRTSNIDLVNMEFASIMAVTCAMARAGKPVMCNGANLAYTKSLWLEAAPHLAAQTHLGGDDMFLLDYAVTHGHKVNYFDAPEVWMDTEAPQSLGEFLLQRRRWAAKWSAYKSPWPLLVGAITILGQFAFAATLAKLVIGQGSAVLMALCLSKAVAEALLLRRQLEKGGMPFSLPAFLFWQLAWLPYVLITALPSLWRRQPVSWKP